MKSISKNGKFMGSVKVGAKGQIVIPKEIRDMFGIGSGDVLVVLADSEKGIAIEKYETFDRIANEIFEGRSGSQYPDKTAEENKIFAEAIKSIRKN